MHKFSNDGDGPAGARVQVTPALDMEDLFTTTAELAHEGKVLRSGMPTPMHLALFVERFRREVRAPFPPAPIVRAVMAPLASLGRRRGHAARCSPAIAQRATGRRPGAAGVRARPPGPRCPSTPLRPGRR